MADPVEQQAATADEPQVLAPSETTDNAIQQPAEQPTGATSAGAVQGEGDDAAASAPEEDLNSKKVTLADLCAKGTALYAHRNFEEASIHYGRAADLQAQINGEMDPENAEILFLYGRSMFKLGQGKSDVLGGKAAAEPKVEKKEKKQKKKKPQETGAQRITEEGIAIVAADKEGEKKEPTEKKALFQFEGDENFAASDEEGEDAEEEDEDEDDDDDLTIAFEVLDLARVLFGKRLEQLEKATEEEKGKAPEGAEGDNPSVRHIKERLGDCHDLLAELSLEQERYPAAIVDCRAALKYKKELYPQESEIIAEAHFKLSLALEFSSITTTEQDGNKLEAIDQEQRNEAIKELEAAIASTKLKLQNTEVDLATMASPEDNEASRSAIADVKDMLEDLEERLEELRGAPLDVNEALYGENGLLGAALGESSAQKEARVEEAKKNAIDVSSLVRKKPKAEAPGTAAAPSQANGETNGKRKAEEPAESEEAKKAKVEEPAEA